MEKMPDFQTMSVTELTKWKQMLTHLAKHHRCKKIKDFYKKQLEVVENILKNR